MVPLRLNFGSVSGLCWAIWRLCWASVGPFLVYVGPLLGIILSLKKRVKLNPLFCWALLGLVGPSRWAYLEASWVMLGLCWAHVGPFGVYVGPMLGHLTLPHTHILPVHRKGGNTFPVHRNGGYTMCFKFHLHILLLSIILLAWARAFSVFKSRIWYSMWNHLS